MNQWKPPGPRAPQQPPPARIEPLPLEVTCRDLEKPGAPIMLTPLGVDHVQRLAAIGASDTAIASALRIDRATFRLIRRRQPEVNEALAAGRAILGIECTHHLLVAARNGEWQAAMALGKFRLGWDGHAISSQQGEDEKEPESDAREVDWSKVPLEERHFLLLAVQRIDELQSGQPRLSLEQRQVLQAHTCLHLTPHQKRQLAAGQAEQYEWVARLTREEREHIRGLAKGPNAPHVLAHLAAMARAAEEPEEPEESLTASGREPIKAEATSDYESLRLVAGVKEEP